MSTVAPIRRNLKNVIKNYSEAQVKVREATSNDPWGPSSSLMTEIADYTYNVVAFSEIMQMIWKRLNDNGKNWRHVYKALSLLEYIIKTGNEKVAQQCKENIFTIQTLKDFQYIEDNKDQGLNVREKAKQIVALLKDDERLKNERTRALKAKERFAQSTSVGYKESDNTIRTKDWETARPLNVGEEELQLRLALAMSKEEAEKNKKIIQGDDLRLQLAISQSEEENKEIGHVLPFNKNPLIDINIEEGLNKASHHKDIMDVQQNIFTQNKQADAKFSKKKDIINLDNLFSMGDEYQDIMQTPSNSASYNTPPYQHVSQDSYFNRTNNISMPSVSSYGHQVMPIMNIPHVPFSQTSIYNTSHPTSCKSNNPFL